MDKGVPGQMGRFVKVNVVGGPPSLSLGRLAELRRV